jgi:excisionase family DNA binding protein
MVRCGLMHTETTSAEFLTVTEAADLLGVHHQTVRRRIEQGENPRSAARRAGQSYSDPTGRPGCLVVERRKTEDASSARGTPRGEGVVASGGGRTLSRSSHAWRRVLVSPSDGGEDLAADRALGLLAGIGATELPVPNFLHARPERPLLGLCGTAAWYRAAAWH